AGDTHQSGASLCVLTGYPPSRALIPTLTAVCRAVCGRRARAAMLGLRGTVSRAVGHASAALGGRGSALHCCLAAYYALRRSAKGSDDPTPLCHHALSTPVVW